jgi:uncharacterized protein YdeI (YjbR/CyaY-like superfamily)
MELHFAERRAWRAWLEENHEKVHEVWLLFYKKHTGVATISYDDAVEEALCYGWIDSLIKRLDEDRYARKFTPRSDTSRWSASNLARIERLKAAGRMTPAGLAKIPDGVTAVVPPAKQVGAVPAYFRDALDANPSARETFEGLAPSYRRNYVAWVDSAKREATRRRRLAEALARLEKGERLPMK